MLFTGSWPIEEVYQIQYLQLEKYMKVLYQELIQADTSIPFLFGGDFNNSPKSLAYEFMKTGAIPATHAELTKQGTETLTITRGLSHQFNGLSSAYASRPQGENTATNYTEHVGTLDYIWYNPALQVYAVVEPYPDEFYRSNLLPNCVIPSDHISLWSDLKIS